MRNKTRVSLLTAVNKINYYVFIKFNQPASGLNSEYADLTEILFPIFSTDKTKRQKSLLYMTDPFLAF